MANVYFSLMAHPSLAIGKSMLYILFILGLRLKEQCLMGHVSLMAEGKRLHNTINLTTFPLSMHMLHPHFISCGRHMASMRSSERCVVHSDVLARI